MSESPNESGKIRNSDRKENQRTRELHRVHLPANKCAAERTYTVKICT